MMSECIDPADYLGKQIEEIVGFGASRFFSCCNGADIAIGEDVFISANGSGKRHRPAGQNLEPTVNLQRLKHCSINIVPTVELISTIIDFADRIDQL